MITKTIFANNWKLKDSTCNTDFVMVTNYPNDVNTIKTTSAVSVLSCMSLCCAIQANSFTFEVSTKNCECFSNVSTSILADDSETSGIIYGQKTSSHQVIVFMKF